MNSTAPPNPESTHAALPACGLDDESIELRPLILIGTGKVWTGLIQSQVRTSVKVIQIDPATGIDGVVDADLGDFGVMMVEESPEALDAWLKLFQTSSESPDSEVIVPTLDSSTRFDKIDGSPENRLSVLIRRSLWDQSGSALRGDPRQEASLKSHLREIGFVDFFSEYDDFRRLEQYCLKTAIVTEHGNWQDDVLQRIPWPK